MKLSVGTYRHLQECSDTRRVFALLAIDHRDNLIAEMQNNTMRSVSTKEVVDFKASVAKHVSSAATAILTDPDFGIGGIDVIPGDIGLLAPLEVTDYSIDPIERQPRLIPGWSLAKLKQAGFCGAKLQIYYHPDAPDAAAKTQLVDTLVVESQIQHVPLFLEPISYSLDPDKPLSSDERRRIAVESARHFSSRGVTALKVEFPVDATEETDERVWKDALHELNEASKVPWILISSNVPFDLFIRQATHACQAGANGIAAGQVIWAEALQYQGEARENFLATVGRERMEQVASICHALGNPWTNYIPVPDVGQHWYGQGRH